MFVELLFIGLLASNVNGQCAAGSRPTIDNGGTFAPEGEIAAEGTVTASCPAGFLLSGGTTIATCDATTADTWTPASFLCVAIICPATTITNGVGTTGDTAYNIVHTFTCNPGYAISGTATLTCDGTQSNNWSAPVPSCEPATCDAPPTTLNQGSFPTMPKGGYNGTVEIICDPGYEAGSTNSSLCTDTNTWNPDTLTCVAITCAALTVANGATSTDTTAATAFNTSVTVTCDTGFKLSSSGALVCDGTTLDNWNVVIPTCDAITCAALTVANGATSTDTTAATAFNTSVNVTCDTGFKLSSSGALVCDGTTLDNWNVVIPTCDAITCMALDIPNGSIQPTTNLTFDHTVTVSCNSGYKINGTATLKCDGTSDNNYDVDTPSCENGGPALFKLQTASMVTVLSMITWLSTQTALL